MATVAGHSLVGPRCRLHRATQTAPAAAEVLALTAIAAAPVLVVVTRMVALVAAVATSAVVVESQAAVAVLHHKGLRLRCT